VKNKKTDEIAVAWFCGPPPVTTGDALRYTRYPHQVDRCRSRRRPLISDMQWAAYPGVSLTAPDTNIYTAEYCPKFYSGPYSCAGVSAAESMAGSGCPFYVLPF